MFLLAERAFEVSPDQGVKEEVPVLPEEEQLGGEELLEAGEDEELVADVKIGNLEEKLKKRSVEANLKLRCPKFYDGAMGG